MTTHSSILAWENPMDRGAWWAIVFGAGCKELDTTEHSRSARQTFYAAGSQATSLLPGHHSSLSTRPPDPVSDGNFSGIASGQAPHHLVSHPSATPGIPRCSAGLGQLAGMTRRVPRVQNPPPCPHLPPLGWEELGGVAAETQTHTAASFCPASDLGEKRAWPQSSAQPPTWGRREPGRRSQRNSLHCGRGWCQEGL